METFTRTILYCIQFLLIFSISNQIYSTHAFTDKPVYIPGEKAYLYSVIQNTKNHTLYCQESLITYFIMDSLDNEIFQGTTLCENGYSSKEYQIPEDIKGGIYTLKVVPTFSYEGRRTFRIRKYEKKEILITNKFDKDIYIPGNTVQAKVCNSDPELSKNTRVKYTVIHEHSTIIESSINTGESNCAYITFLIPTLIEENLYLSIEFISSNGKSQSESFNVPLVDLNLFLNVYPESGYIIEDEVNKFYFEVATKGGYPAHIENANLIKEFQNKRTIELSNISSTHHGRGKFEINITKNAKYFIELIKGRAIKELVEIKLEPSPLNISFTVLNPVFEDGEDLLINVIGLKNNSRNYNISIFNKYELLYSQKFRHTNSITELTVPSQALKDFPSGVFSLEISLDISLAIPLKNLNEYASSYYPYPHQPIHYLSRLIFKLPPKDINLSVSEMFEVNSIPEKNGFTLNFPIKPINRNSLLVISRIFEMSSLNEVGEMKVPPNLKSSLLLEDEVYKNNTEKELYFNSEYLNNEISNEIKNNIDLILSIQDWRRSLFHNRFIEKLDPYQTNKLQNEGYLYNMRGFGRNRMYKNNNPAIVEMEDFQEVAFNAINENNINEVYYKGIVKEQTLGYNGNVADSSPPSISKSDTSSQSIIRYDLDEINENIMNQLAERTLHFSIKFINDSSTKIHLSVNKTISGGKYVLIIETIDREGKFGYIFKPFEISKPLSLEMKLPNRIISADDAYVEVVTSNNMRNAASLNIGFNIVACMKNGIPSPVTYTFKEEVLHIPPNNVSRTFRKIPNSIDCEEIMLEAKCCKNISEPENCLKDYKKVKIVPKGISKQFTQSGIATINQPSSSTSISLPFHLPTTAKNSKVLDFEAKLYPSILQTVLDAIETLIREPHGCFEQTSSTTYPMVMALQLLEIMPSNPRTEDAKFKIKGLLKDGYSKLIKYESPNGGFEWFGGDPGHETLTAYGLLQFFEMNKAVDYVDKNMINRTVNWLINRKLNNGYFGLSERALDSFGRSPIDISSAYIIFSLTEYINITQILPQQLNKLISISELSSDSYLIAIASQAYYILGKKDLWKKYASKLAQYQRADGSISNATTSITSSGGINLLLETTALSVITWLNDYSAFSVNIEKATRYIISQIKDGTFGSTQSTILSLKALVKYYSKISTQGNLTASILIGNEKLNEKQITENLIDPISLSSNVFNKVINDTINGTLLISSSIPRGNESQSITYGLSYRYYDEKPESEIDDIEFNIEGQKDYKQNDFVRYRVEVRNKNDSLTGMLVAILSFPSGFEINVKEIERQKAKGSFDAFEINNELILYWRNIEKKQLKDFDIVGVAKYKGNYFSKPSVLYKYYDNEHKMYTPSLEINIS